MTPGRLLNIRLKNVSFLRYIYYTNILNILYIFGFLVKSSIKSSKFHCNNLKKLILQGLPNVVVVVVVVVIMLEI